MNSADIMSRMVNPHAGYQTAIKQPLATGKGNSSVNIRLNWPFKASNSLPEIWYEVFMWNLLSSVILYSVLAVIAFLTLRKHKFGRFYSLMILVMGVFLPLTIGVLSSAAVAFVYKTSSFPMPQTHAIFWGGGQTVIHALFGVTRILATL